MVRDLKDYSMLEPLQGFSDEEIRKLMKMLSKLTAKTFEKFYFEKKSLRQIAAEEGVTFQAIEKRINVAVRNMYTYSDYTYVLVGLRGKSTFDYGKKSLLEYRQQFKERLKLLGFKTEVLPYLSEEEIVYIDNMIKAYNPEEVEEFRKKENKPNPSHPFKKIVQIIEKMDKIIEKRQQVSDFVKRIGGKSQVALIDTFLTEDERTYFHKKVLSVDPRLNPDIFENDKSVLANLGNIKYNVERKISFVLNAQKFRKDFFEKIGGENELCDIELFLTDEEKYYLNEDFLSLNPDCMKIVREKLGMTSAEYTEFKRKVAGKVERVLKRKEECQKFIEENGEDFLIYEFGASLPEEQFEVLLYLIMDYHYLSVSNLSEEMEKDLFSAKSVVLDKLSNYKKRKQEVDEYVAKIGEEQILEFAKILTDAERKILFEYILGYGQPSARELSEELGTSEKRVYKLIDDVRRWLYEFETTKRLPIKWIDPPPKQKD